MDHVRIINQSPYPLPQYETKGSAGMDLKAHLDEAIVLEPMERTLIPTGLFIELPDGFEGQVRPRSGLSIRHGITLVNAVGTIDSDYRGEIKVPVINLSQSSYCLNPGERIAQLVIAKYHQINWNEVKTINETDRGAGGFGSTGK